MGYADRDGKSAGKGASVPYEQMIESMNQPLLFTTSADQGELYAAMAKAQGEIDGAAKGRYADLASVREASSRALADNGLAVIAFPVAKGGKMAVVSRLTHSSGQWMQGEYPIDPPANDGRKVGSAIHDARRHTLMAITGLAPQEDDRRPAAEKPKQGPADPEKSRETFDDFAAKLLGERNGEWRDEQASHGVAAGKQLALGNNYSLVNFLVSLAVEQNVVRAEKVGTDADPTKRDGKKAYKAACWLWQNWPDWVAEQAADHLAENRVKLRAKLGFTDDAAEDGDDDPLDRFDDGVGKGDAWEGPEPAIVGKTK